MTETRVGGAALDYRDSEWIPPQHQQGFWDRMTMVVALMDGYRQSGEPLVDIGCNGGSFLGLVSQPSWGYDIAAGPLQVARAAGHDARYADITVDELELAPIVTICEVLEHLDDPHSVVRRLAVDPVRIVVASGPYLETEEDHYEQHVWAWDEAGFAELFRSAGFTVHEQATAGIFQALVAERE